MHRLLRLTVATAAAAALTLPFLAADADAAKLKSCPGPVETSQPDGGRKATRISVLGASCTAAKTVAMHFSGLAGQRPKDDKGHRWTFVKSRFKTGGLRATFKRGSRRIAFTTALG